MLLVIPNNFVKYKNYLRVLLNQKNKLETFYQKLVQILKI